MSRSWEGGSTRAWRKTRARVLAANPGGRCRVDVGQGCTRHGRRCPNVCTGTATCVHHVNGKRAGDRAENLLPSCRACNLHVGDPLHARPAAQPRTRW